MILVFSLIYLDIWVYISGGAPSGCLKSVVLSSPLFLSLSGAPLSLGPLDIVHSCHPVATPLDNSGELQQPPSQRGKPSGEQGLIEGQYPRASTKLCNILQLGPAYWPPIKQGQ